MTVTWNGQTHKAAQKFPMLSAEELDELTADVAKNGLRHPIVLLPDGTLLDGRNRQAACHRAGVEPTYTVYEGDDPIGFVTSENLARRHLTTGQKAMVAVELEELYAEELAAKRAKAEDGKWAPTAETSTEGTNGATWPTRDTMSKNERARDLAAKATGASGKSVDRAKRVAQADKKLAEKVTKGEIDLAKAETAVKLRAEGLTDLADKLEAGEVTRANAEAVLRAAIQERIREEEEAYARRAGWGEALVLAAHALDAAGASPAAIAAAFDVRPADVDGALAKPPQFLDSNAVDMALQELISYVPDDALRVAAADWLEANADEAEKAERKRRQERERQEELEKHLDIAERSLRSFISGVHVLEAVKRGQYPEALMDRFSPHNQRILRHYIETLVPCPLELLEPEGAR